ncbi:MAG: sigma-E factor negative regulatory protein [Halioglobus sp.]|nr:sigma-E factor negative regulatory protein [Halioglobus sp.]
MSERLNESLSALMDDEANELEIERVLSEASVENSLRAKWVRYNLVRHSLDNHALPQVGWDISQRVKAALPAGHNDGAASKRWLRPLTSFAVAASVATTVVVGGRQLADMGAGPQYEVGGTVATGASPVGFINSVGATAIPASYGTQPLPMLQPITRTAYDELAQQRSSRYQQEHAQQASRNTPQGLIHFARLPTIRD